MGSEKSWLSVAENKFVFPVFAGFTHLTGLKHHQLAAHEFKQEQKCLTCGQDYSELCKQSGHDRGSKWNEASNSVFVGHAVVVVVFVFVVFFCP